jgi:gliding motility-associated protein GldC
MADKTSQIRIDVHLDENHVPDGIEWEADDQPGKNVAKSALISFWDERENNSLRIDLWTKQMTTDEMKSFFHQNLMTLADTFERATSEKEMAGHMRAFGRYFGEQMCGIDPQG